jgi:guanosine-3',5'-bis(diphosphate) 3'-pyrophosphohydrolase
MATEAVKRKINNIIKIVEKNDPDADADMIMRAFNLADHAHKGQKRKSGEDYIIHPVAVAYILAKYRMDSETICAALLHDVIEDTDTTHEQIAEMFNPKIADLVEGVTKIGKIDYQSKEESQAEYIRKMVMAMSKDIRVILIKLVDRLHNMRTLEYMTEAKQKEKARETLDIYAPIANRLGIQAIKAELEDLSLKYLDPEGYYNLVKSVKTKKQAREEYVNQVIDILKKKLDEVGIPCKVYGRSKHFYSIYRKMKAQHRKFDEIYDLIAVRVIVNTVKECYGVLGTVHTEWKPIPGRFKDYIAMPKPNMYQSIHTTVIGPNGDPVEIQIRTKEMHRIAEYGIAAHWKYKEGKGNGKNAKDVHYEKKIAWLRQIMEWQQELDNAGDLLETIKVDLLNEEVYAFSPKGDVFELPVGSCPLDFAYRVHSDIGNNCVGAKVNGKIVPLNYKLSNGDIVEVMTSKHSNGPSRDWLNFVKSAHARNKIKQYFKRETKEENIEKGKLALENELKRQGLQDTKLGSIAELEVLSKHLKYKTLDDLYAAIGYNGIKMGTVFTKMKLLFPEVFKDQKPDITAKKRPKPERSSSNILVAGLNDIDVHLAKCCSPVPGDQIIGHITQSHGITVHRTDCLNVLHIDASKTVDVEWNKFGVSGNFSAEISIQADENPHTLIEINKVFIEMNISLTALTARNEKGKFDYFEAVFEVKSRRELNLVIKNIKKIPSVLIVKRI